MVEFCWCAVVASGAASMAVASSAADPISVVSPNGRNEIRIEARGDGVRCTALRDGAAVLDDAAIGLVIEGVGPVPADPPLTEIARTAIDRVERPVVPTTASRFDDRYREVAVRVDAIRSLRLRAYDEGVAYRWELAAAGETLTIVSEGLALLSLSTTDVWLPVPNGEGFWSHQECTFDRGVFGELLDDAPRSAPVLFSLGGNEYAVLSDVNNHAYPGLWVVAGGDGPRATFPPYPRTEVVQNMRNTRVGEAEPVIARVPGDAVLPWRAMAFDDAAGLLTNPLFYLLAEPSRLDDTSWIRPGLVSWDWWNALNIGGVDFTSGINQRTYEHYIDFAAEYGLPYVILDEGWSRPEPDGLLNVVPEIDMAALSAYAEARGVDLILWMTATMLEARFDEAFEQFERWGIAGIKVDFMQRDDQVMMERCYRIAEAAAAARLLVDFHGGSKPQGITRTYPNVLTIESVMGLEQVKWGGPANPELAALLPFTRMVVGPMDYTPGAMRNANRKQFKASMDRPMSLGTRAHQLAMYVVYASPLQMLADTPTNYRLYPESTRFIAQMPVTWDETVPLVAQVGDVVAVARRHGEDWYIGALCDWTAREITVGLSFLNEGSYGATIAADGPNARTLGEDVVFTERTLTADDTLTLRLAPGGGAAAALRRR